jgi:hypothetical protein
MWADPTGTGAQVVAIIAFLALIGFFIRESFKAKETD